MTKRELNAAMDAAEAELGPRRWEEAGGEVFLRLSSLPDPPHDVPKWARRVAEEVRRADRGDYRPRDSSKQWRRRPVTGLDLDRFERKEASADHEANENRS